MGAGESKANGPGAVDAQAAVPDYYELLQVDENATADEIKVRALELHDLAGLQPNLSHLVAFIQKAGPHTPSRQKSHRCRGCD
jgi:hypothetical protein